MGNLTLAHLRDLPISHFHLLLKPVTHYLAVLAGIGPTPVDIAAGAEASLYLPPPSSLPNIPSPLYNFLILFEFNQSQVRVTPDELVSKVPPLTVTPSTSFAELLFTIVSLNQGGMNSNRILHRAHVVNAEGK